MFRLFYFPVLCLLSYILEAIFYIVPHNIFIYFFTNVVTGYFIVLFIIQNTSLTNKSLCITVL